MSYTTQMAPKMANFLYLSNVPFIQHRKFDESKGKANVVVAAITQWTLWTHMLNINKWMKGESQQCEQRRQSSQCGKRASVYMQQQASTNGYTGLLYDGENNQLVHWTLSEGHMHKWCSIVDGNVQVSSSPFLIIQVCCVAVLYVSVDISSIRNRQSPEKKYRTNQFTRKLKVDYQFSLSH